jgi:hypothetical protein
MMPPQLAARIGPTVCAALERFLRVAKLTLEEVYDANVADYSESRGDDAQLLA